MSFSAPSPLLFALTAVILRHDLGADPAPGEVAAVAAFIARQRGQIPDCLRPPFTLLNAAFAADVWLRTRQRFAQLSHERQYRQLLRWRASSLQPMRDLMSFYERLAIFAYYALGAARLAG